MTSRIVQITNVVERREAVAPRIVINWNLDNTGNIEFWVNHSIERDGVLQSNLELDTRPQMCPLRVNIMDIIGRTFNVPLPNGSTQPVPCMLLMGAIKQAFDEFYSEKVLEIENTPPPPDPNATPTPTETPTETPSASVEPTPSPSVVEPTPTPTLSGA